jgi:ion channel-forming bestrophin family protein
MVGVKMFANIHLDTQSFYRRWLDASKSALSSVLSNLKKMQVFRNQTSYDRFWQGRNHVTTVATSVRNLTRSFLACSHNANHTKPSPNRAAELADTESTVKILVAMLYTLKNHLRADWGAYSDKSPHKYPSFHPQESEAEYTELLPPGLVGLEDRGVGVTLQLALLVEGYIKRGFQRDWWNGPQSSQLTVQLNTLITAYGAMETIRLTPVPVAHLIHQKQVLALFGAILPFATVAELDWWTIPITTVVVFTLYGIDGIAWQLEDPFGYDRIDIPLDAIIEDTRAETLVLLDEWKTVCENEWQQDGTEWGREWFTSGVRNTPIRARFED